MNLNHIIIAGHVSQAPELRMTPGGQSVASMGVATNRTWTDKAGAKQENVQFHSVVLWGRNADIASQFLQKGSPVLIEGRVETREWTDKQGAKHYKTEIICENLQLGQRQAKEETKAEAPAPQRKPVHDVKLERETRRDDIGGQDRSMKPMFGEEPEIKPEEIPF